MMRSAILLRASLALVQVLLAGGAGAATFPIQRADDAIALAKHVCLKYGPHLYDEDMNITTIRKAMPSLQWSATLEGDHWSVDTMPSVNAGTNDHLLFVDIPVAGPAPTECAESMYELLSFSPKVPKPRAACKPSDISEVDAQHLAFEAVAPHGGVALTALRPRSVPDVWIVSVSRTGHSGPGVDTQKWLFKVFKRSAIVLNTATGEAFLSLPSKAQFVEHHCLDMQPAK